MAVRVQRRRAFALSSKILQELMSNYAPLRKQPRSKGSSGPAFCSDHEACSRLPANSPHSRQSYYRCSILAPAGTFFYGQYLRTLRKQFSMSWNVWGNMAQAHVTYPNYLHTQNVPFIISAWTQASSPDTASEAPQHSLSPLMLTMA